MLKERAVVLKKINIIIDLCLTILSFILAYYLRLNLSPTLFPSLFSFPNYLWLLYIIIPLWGFLLYYHGVYGPQRLESLSRVCWKITKSILYGGLILSTAIFLNKTRVASRSLIILFLVINESLLVMERVILKYVLQVMRRGGYNYRTILVVGTGKRAQKFVSVVQSHKEWGLKIVGLIDQEPSMLGQSICGLRVLGVLENLPAILHNSEIDEVFFIVPRSWLSFLEEAILACEEMGIKTRLAGDLFSHKIATTHFQKINGQSFLTFDTTPQHKQGVVLAKRVIDIVVSCLCLTITWPLFLLVTVVIKRTSIGPVFFKQIRCGRNGKRFTMLKFRTMVLNAEDLQPQIKHLNEVSGPVFKVKDDPRLTKPGKFLRKTSLDELPQLINVLKGDMSLVGPRPPIPSEVEKYDRWHRRRLSVKPGVTCFWQISGRNEIDFEQWMELDLKYIDNWSLGLDFKILLKTLPVVLIGKGAR